ncbi:B30.2/SPRY domain-containing protein [Entamoeba marina]
MKVALHFPTFYEILNFICVNKKCLDTLNALKMNPWFRSNVYDEEFFKYFQPETLHPRCTFFEDSKDLYFAAKRIRDFSVDDFKKCEEDLYKIFPKVTSFGFLNFSNEEKNYICKHATEFHNLQSVYGSLSNIVDFFKSYTNDGKDKYVRLPKKIFIYIYQYQREKKSYGFRVLFDCWLNAEELSVAQEFYIYTTSFSDQPTQYFKGVICDGGIVRIKNMFGDDKFNQTIEDCYANKVEINFSYDYHRLSGTDSWTIPDCVKALIIKNFYDDFIGNKEPIPIQLNRVEKICLRDCTFLNLFTNLSRVIKLTINSSRDISFSDNIFGQLQFVKVVNSGSFSLLVGKHLKKLLMISSHHVTFYGSFEELTDFTMIDCFEITLPLFSFENKVISIEDCKPITFKSLSNGVTSNENPLSYKQVTLEDFNTLIENTLYLPTDDIQELLSYKDKFRVRKFNSISTSVEVNQNEILHTSTSTKDKVVTIFSNNFFNADESKYLLLYNNLGELVKVDSTIRYCEIEVIGLCLLSFGLTSKRYKELDKHIGWSYGTIGYHADDGWLYHSTGHGRPYGSAYGSKPQEKNYIGCGYDSTTNEVFFCIEWRKT